MTVRCKTNGEAMLHAVRLAWKLGKDEEVRPIQKPEASSTSTQKEKRANRQSLLQCQPSRTEGFRRGSRVYPIKLQP